MAVYSLCRSIQFTKLESAKGSRARSDLQAPVAEDWSVKLRSTEVVLHRLDVFGATAFFLHILRGLLGFGAEKSEREDHCSFLNASTKKYSCLVTEALKSSQSTGIQNPRLHSVLDNKDVYARL